MGKRKSANTKSQRPVPSSTKNVRRRITLLTSNILICGCSSVVAGAVVEVLCLLGVVGGLFSVFRRGGRSHSSKI